MVSIQVAIFLAIVLTIAIAVANNLYTTLAVYLYCGYAGLRLPVGRGHGGEAVFSSGRLWGLKIVGVELNGHEASEVKVVVRGREVPEIKAGDVGYVKAFFPRITLTPGQMAVGRVVTLQGFSFFFTPQISNAEGGCPGD